jgi:hypothetical protein
MFNNISCAIATMGLVSHCRNKLGTKEAIVTERNSVQKSLAIYRTLAQLQTALYFNIPWASDICG